MNPSQLLIAALMTFSVAVQAKGDEQVKDYKPAGIQSLVPFVYVEDVPKYVEFVSAAFGIEAVTETKDDNGHTFYATMQFDDTTYFVNEASEEMPTSSLALYLYVPDLDAAYKRALEAGATSIAEPAEQYHGDSLAILTDSWGNQWYLGYASVILTDDQIRERRQAEEANEN